MRTWLVALAIGVTMTSLGAQSKPTMNGPVPRLPDGTVDLSGVWVGGGPVDDIERQGGLKPGELDALMLPSAKALMASRKIADDPHNFCLPMGVPRQPGGLPWRFVQWPTHKAATHIFMLQEGNAHMFRQIFMDGREHPDELDPSWFGHSIGHYEGTTLVIDTVGYNDRFWFDRRGRPHTEQLHTLERWTRVDFGHMQLTVTIDDPGAYSKPWTTTFMATLNPDDDLLEYVCLENNQFGTGSGNSNPYYGR